MSTSAQGPRFGGLLDIPDEKQMRCRATEPTDSVTAFSFEFEIGNDRTDSRTIRVNYDKTGAMIYLIETNSRSANGVVMENIALGFASDGTAKGMRSTMSHPAGNEGKAIADPIQEDITIADVQKAKQLADWLWERRCRKNP